jgi:WD40 repeat protein
MSRTTNHTGIYSLNFDSRNDNKLLMSGSVDKSIRIWDVTKYKNVRYAPHLTPNARLHTHTYLTF